MKWAIKVVGVHSCEGGPLGIGSVSGPLTLQVLSSWPGHATSTRDVMRNVTGSAA